MNKIDCNIAAVDPTMLEAIVMSQLGNRNSKNWHSAGDSRFQFFGQELGIEIDPSLIVTLYPM